MSEIRDSELIDHVAGSEVACPAPSATCLLKPVPVVAAKGSDNPRAWSMYLYFTVSVLTDVKSTHANQPAERNT